jgi:hypothetical protein
VRLLGRNALRQTAGAATSINGIRFEHDGRPRVEALNGKSDQPSVNETKPALFLMTSNERLAVDARAERFAMMMARLAPGGTKFDATQHTSRMEAR